MEKRSFIIIIYTSGHCPTNKKNKRKPNVSCSEVVPAKKPPILAQFLNQTFAGSSSSAQSNKRNSSSFFELKKVVLQMTEASSDEGKMIILTEFLINIMKNYPSGELGNLVSLIHRSGKFKPIMTRVLGNLLASMNGIAIDVNVKQAKSVRFPEQFRKEKSNQRKQDPVTIQDVKKVLVELSSFKNLSTYNIQKTNVIKPTMLKSSSI